MHKEFFMFFFAGWNIAPAAMIAKYSVDEMQKSNIKNEKYH